MKSETLFSFIGTQSSAFNNDWHLFSAQRNDRLKKEKRKKKRINQEQIATCSLCNNAQEKLKLEGNDQGDIENLSSSRYVLKN